MSIMGTIPPGLMASHTTRTEGCLSSSYFWNCLYQSCKWAELLPCWDDFRLWSVNSLQLRHRSWQGRDNGRGWWWELSSLGIVFVSFLKENIPKNENVRSKGSEREVLEMSVSQATDTMPKIVFLKLCYLWLVLPGSGFPGFFLKPQG